MKRLRPVCVLAAFCLLPPFAARSQNFPAKDITSSASGQFWVSSVPAAGAFYHRPEIGTNTGIIRLEPSLLAVSAERFKAALWRDIGLEPNAAWRGKIFLVLHPARALDEPVTLTAQPFFNRWSYRLELPDMLSRERCGRALAAALLLEIANRTAPLKGSAVTVPAWLPDGLTRLALQRDAGQLLLSAPAKTIDGLAQDRLNEKRQGFDDLADARPVLQNYATLTFDQLSWPDDAQLGGRDGGAYLASAQLFVHELLALKNGPAMTRAFLDQLPACANWQTAFFRAFKADFATPLAVEKWWSLHAVAFAAHDPGPRWNAAVSRQKLAALLAVPVDIRYDSNALPTRAEITLQTMLQNFSEPQQLDVVRTKLRDLELAQLRFAPQFAALADGYRAALAEFLGEPAGPKKKNPANKHGARRHSKITVAAMVEKLDALDAQRHELEYNLDRTDLPLPTKS
jgi:hypothetical protein